MPDVCLISGQNLYCLELLYFREIFSNTKCSVYIVNGKHANFYLIFAKYRFILVPGRLRQSAVGHQSFI